MIQQYTKENSFFVAILRLSTESSSMKNAYLVFGRVLFIYFICKDPDVSVLCLMLFIISYFSLFVLQQSHYKLNIWIVNAKCILCLGFIVSYKVVNTNNVLFWYHILLAHT